jgi:hypothetical protein
VKDYSCISVQEAAEEEIIRQFIETVKKLDTELSVRRLNHLTQSIGEHIKLINTMAAFVAILNVKTSVDFHN